MGTLSSVAGVLSLTPDAASNIFDVYVTWPTFFKEGSTNFYMEDSPGIISPARFQGEFKLPEYEMGAFTALYKNHKIKKPSGAMVGEKNLQLTFLIDAYYQIYMDFLKWRNLTLNPDTGFIHTALTPQVLGQITIVAPKRPPILGGDSIHSTMVTTMDSELPFLDDTEHTPMYWQFNDVWIEKVTEPSFNTTSNTFQKVTIKCSFGYMSTPATNKMYNSYARAEEV